MGSNPSSQGKCSPPGQAELLLKGSTTGKDCTNQCPHLFHLLVRAVSSSRWALVHLAGDSRETKPSRRRWDFGWKTRGKDAEMTFLTHFHVCIIAGCFPRYCWIQ